MMSDPLIFFLSLLQGGLRSPPLRVKPVQGVGSHHGVTGLSQGSQQGWARDTQPSATQMSRVKKRG